MEAQAALPFLGDDIFVLIAAELDACMLGRLACTAPRFWRASVADPAHKGGGPPELWSVAEEGARRRLVADAQSEQVLWRAAGGGAWLRALAASLKSKLPPLKFERVHSMLRLSDREIEAKRRQVLLVGDTVTGATGHYRAAATKVVMRAGQHYAEFEALTGVGGGESGVSVGVIRPTWDVEGGVLPSRESGHAFYWLPGGHKFPGNEGWSGMEEACKGDTIGLLLDIDKGTLTVFKKAATEQGMRRLGVMATGLSGEFCWAVSLRGEKRSARIRSAPIPV